jgi:hypothetical protein
VKRCGNLIGKITASFSDSLADSNPATSSHLTFGVSITIAPENTKQLFNVDKKIWTFFVLCSLYTNTFVLIQGCSLQLTALGEGERQEPSYVLPVMGGGGGGLGRIALPKITHRNIFKAFMNVLKF